MTGTEAAAAAGLSVDVARLEDDEEAASLAWDQHCAAGLALGASVAMADLIRQADEQCAERAAAMTAAWNLLVTVMDTMAGDHQSKVKLLFLVR
jgi:hypothetical protein